MFSGSKPKLVSNYLSPITDSKAFKKKSSELKEAGTPLIRRNSLLVEVEDGKESIYQRDNELLGEGSNGIAFKFTHIQDAKKSKVVKIDKKVEGWIAIIEGLRAEWFAIKRGKACDYATLIEVMELHLVSATEQDKLTIDNNLRRLKQGNIQLSPTKPTKVLFRQYLNMAKQKIEARVEERKGVLEHEAQLTNTIYGNTAILPDNYRLAMPILPKKTLAEVLEEQPQKTPLELLDLLINILHTYEAFHQLFQIAQIDIKEDNILIDEDGAIWPCDFGLSWEFGTNVFHEALDTTKFKHYAPELRTGATVDAKLDIYSLGRLALNSFLPLIPSATSQNLIHDQTTFLKEYTKISNDMHEAKSASRKITLVGAKMRFMALRSKHFLNAPPLKLTLNPIFTQKKAAIHEAKLSQLESQQEIKSMLSTSLSETALEPAVDHLVIVDKWEEAEESLKQHLQQNNQVPSNFIDETLASLDEEIIPEKFVNYILQTLTKTKQWNDIRRIIEKLSTKRTFPRDTFEKELISILLSSKDPQIIQWLVFNSHIEIPELNQICLHAALNKDWDLVQILASKTASDNTSKADGLTPLHLAIKARKFDVAKKLIDCKAVVNFQSVENETPAPIHLAIANQDDEAIKFLFNYSINFDVIYEGKQLIEYAVLNGIQNNNWNFILNALEKHDFIINNVLNCLIKYQKWDVIQCLSYPLAKKNYHYLLEQAIWPAAKNDAWDLVIHLIKLVNEPPELKDYSKGYPIVHFAIDHENEYAVKNLLALTKKDKYDLLHYAIKEKKWKSTQIILNEVLEERPPITAIAPILKQLKKGNVEALVHSKTKLNALMIHYINNDDERSVEKLQRIIGNHNIITPQTLTLQQKWKRSNSIIGLPGTSIGGIIGATIGFFIPLPGAIYFGMAIGIVIGGYVEKFIRDKFIKKVRFPLDPDLDNTPPSYSIKHLSFPQKIAPESYDLTPENEDKSTYQFLRGSHDQQSNNILEESRLIRK